MDRCSGCRFATKEANFREHECRRHSPAMIQVESSVDTRIFVPKWPVVKSEDWCGDYEPQREVHG